MDEGSPLIDKARAKIALKFQKQLAEAYDQYSKAIDKAKRKRERALAELEPTNRAAIKVKSNDSGL